MMLRATNPQPVPASPVGAWDDTPCPLCGRREEELLLEAPDPTPGDGPVLHFAVVRCRSCSLTYTNPRPDEHTIGRFYPADYRPHRRPRKMRHAAPSPVARWSGRSVPERDGGLPWVGQGRLLDFGCGGGSYMKRMADQGWRVTGLDAAVGAVREIQEELGLRAIVGSLPHPELAPGSFDVVTMWHSLEHVHRPLAILREAYKLLVPGGKLIVATPNIASAPFRLFRENWFGLDLPRHLTHFTAATLRAMLETAGFRPDPVRQIRHGDWLRSSARLAARDGRGGPVAKLLKWKPVAKLAALCLRALGGSDCVLCVAERPA